MSNENGWIKAYRSWMRNPLIWKDADHIAVWMYLYLNATHEDYQTLFKGKTITLHPGQLITGRKVIANSTHVEESKVYRILTHFCREDAQLIEQQKSNKNTLITLKNWCVEQISEQQNDAFSPPNRHRQEEKKKEKGNSSKLDADQFLEDFEKIYAVYPKKVGKAKSIENVRKWIGAGFKIDGRLYKASKREIYNAIIEYKLEKLDGDLTRTPEKDELQYWKDFSTLTGKALLDYIERARNRERENGGLHDK